LLWKPSIEHTVAQGGETSLLCSYLWACAHKSYFLYS